MQIVLLPVFLVFVPIALGLPWMNHLAKERQGNWLACFPLGYFLELSIFQLLTFPFSVLRWTFSSLCWTMIFITALCCTASLIIYRKGRTTVSAAVRWNGWEILYAVTFAGLLCWQVYHAAVLDPTIMTYDDAYYVTVANDALTQNHMFMTQAYTGLGTRLDIHRSMQSSLIFPAYLSFVSGLPVTVIARTVQAVFHVLLAYAVYAWLGYVLFRRRDTVFVFLIILSFLYIFGYYSMYSVTFRLLGPNNQGKAVLAVSYFPCLFALLIDRLDQPFSRKTGLLLMLFSIPAAGLTLFGTVTTIANATAAIGLSMLRKERNWEHGWYILWACLFPAIYGGIFFINRFAL